MTRGTRRQWGFKLLRLTLLFLLIVGTVDLLVVTSESLLRKVISPPSWSNRSWREVLREPVAEHKEMPPRLAPQAEPDDDLDFSNAGPISDQRLSFQIRPDGMTARYEIELDRHHPLLIEVQSGRFADNMNLLVKHLCGEIRVNEQSLEYYPADVVVPENQNTARIAILSRKVDPHRQKFGIYIYSPKILLPMAASGMTVVFETEQAKVWSETELLAFKTAERTAFVLPAERRSVGFVITLSQWTVQAEAAKERLVAIINRSYDPPVADPLMIGLLEALPFLLLLFWSRRYQFNLDQPEFVRHQRLIGVYLVYHFLYYGFIATSELISKWGNPALRLLYQVQNRLALPISVFPGKTFIMMTMMASWFYLWPAISARRLMPDKQERKWQTVAAVSVIILLFVTLSGSVVFVLSGDYQNVRSGSWSLGSFYVITLSGLLLLLLSLCIWVAGEISPRRRAVAATTFFFILVYLVASNDGSWLSSHPTIKATIHLVNYILVVTALTATFGKLIYTALTGKSLQVEWRGWSGAGKAMALLVILGVAFSTRSWRAPMDYWPIWSLSWELKTLFYLALISILARFLRSVSMNRSVLALPASARMAGILLALSLFYSPAARWNYIPVCFLIGYLLLTHWLIPAKRLDRSLFAEFSGIEGKLPQVISQIIRYNDAERIYKMLKKELLARVGKGELSYEEYTEKLEVQRESVAAIRRDLTIEGHFAKEIVLGFGPTDSAWENGKRTSLYSLIFALPWILFYLRNLAVAPAPVDSYIILALFNLLASLVATWISYGFIFGYFYPSIIGRNGMQKGLALWLTIIIPNLVWTALADTLNRQSWQAFGFWALQIFVHSMLMGLVAGDYEILRKAGYRFSDLLEVHRMSSLSAWASSMLVAISAAIATLLTSGAVEAISSVLKYAGLIPNGINLPTK